MTELPVLIIGGGKSGARVARDFSDDARAAAASGVWGA
jgi:hypothetical protein